MEVTILMPCLNEAETLQTCILKAKNFLSENKVDGEILISDNGSTDGSPQIAEKLGARVVHAEEKGYGSALITGCKEASGKYVIMGDADDSYDFVNLMPFLEKLREGYDLVMGDRFRGGIEAGAMPWSHRYIGNPVLSFIGRLFFKSKVHDFHCGLRGYRRESILSLSLQTTGMEYASEMIIKAELSGLRITEVPTTLKKDGRSRPPHLRDLQDGWRHLVLLFMYSPDWLFLYPGIFLLLTGMIGCLFLLSGDPQVNGTHFSINTLLYCQLFVMLGINVILHYLLVKLYAFNYNLFPRAKKDWNKAIKENHFIIFGLLLAFAGFVLSIVAVIEWKQHAFGNLEPERFMRLTIPAASIAVIGLQCALSGFVMGIIKLSSKSRDS